MRAGLPAQPSLLGSGRAAVWGDAEVPETPANDSPSGAQLLGLGVMLAVGVLVPLAAGIALDVAAHTGPLGLLLGIVAGVAAAIVIVYTRFKRYL